MGKRETLHRYGGLVVMEYEDSTHKYYVNIPSEGAGFSWVPSVTGITGKAFDKSFKLMRWAKKLMMFKLAGLLKADQTVSAIEKSQILKAVESAADDERDHAAMIGNAVHEWIEQHIKSQMDPGLEAPPRPTDENVRFAVTQFLDWESKYYPEYLETEYRCYSMAHHFAGTFDLLCRINGVLYLIDFKTTSGVYPAMFAQLAAYDIAFREEYDLDSTGESLRTAVLWLPKKPGMYGGKVYRFAELPEGKTEFARETFLACQKIYKAEKELKV